MVNRLSKTYDNVTYAVHDLTMNIPQGAVFGFLGPNGAGKTTTVKLLTGLLRPTEGTCTVMGLSPSERTVQVHQYCGVMTETAKSYGNLSGMENLVFFGQAFGMEEKNSRARAEELLKLLDLWDARDKCLSAYSTGMAQRLSLARALINRPKVLFLDEPTSGLDPESSQTVNDLIRRLAASEGTTVFLCTHQLRYAQDLCESYGILSKGLLLARGSLESLRQKAGLPIRAAFRLKEGEVPPGLKRRSDGWWQTDITDELQMPKLLRNLVESGREIFEARLVKPTLEDIYFQFVENGGALS